MEKLVLYKYLKYHQQPRSWDIFSLFLFFLVLLIIKIHVSASCLVSTVGVIYLNTTFFFQLSTRVCAIAGVMAYGYSNNAKHG